MESKIAQKYTKASSSFAFAGASTVKKSKEGEKYKTSEIRKGLRQVPAYLLHHPIRKRFPRRFVSVDTINHQWGADLIEVKHPKSNYNKRYILAVLDHFSRSAWLEALPNKTAITVVNAMKKIFKRSKRSCKVFQTDDGLEFKNSRMKDLLAPMGIKHFITSSSTKCCINERFNRTLGQRIARYLTHTKSKRFVHKLKDFERQYNNTYHSTIRCTPNEVNSENISETWQNIYSKKIQKLTKKGPSKFKLGDRVLIPIKKGIFQKGYDQTFGEKVHVITQVRKTKPVTYYLKTEDGIPIKGSWYNQELVGLN